MIMPRYSWCKCLDTLYWGSNLGGILKTLGLNTPHIIPWPKVCSILAHTSCVLCTLCFIILSFSCPAAGRSLTVSPYCSCICVWVLSLCVIIQASKLSYQPLTVAVTPLSRDSVYEPPVREPPLREIPEPQMCEPLSTQLPLPGLTMLPRGLAAEASRPVGGLHRSSFVDISDHHDVANVSNSLPVGVPGSKFEMSTPAATTASPRVTDLSPSGLDIRPVSIAMTSPAALSPVVASGATSVPQMTTFRSPVSATPAATVPVVRRRSSDKSNLPIAVGEWSRLVFYLHLILQSDNNTLCLKKKPYRYSHNFIHQSMADTKRRYKC